MPISLSPSHAQVGHAQSVKPFPLCWVCHRPPRGFGWSNNQSHTLIKVFCSRVCQQMHSQKIKQGQQTTAVHSRKAPPLERDLIQALLKPLGEYVAHIGIDKPLGDYQKTEIVGLMVTLLETYHELLIKHYQQGERL